MIFGIGTDIVSIARFVHWTHTPSLMQRFFSLREIDWCCGQGERSAASLAARFAAKEAFGKALGTGLKGIALRDIEVIRLANGQPQLVLGPSALKQISERLADRGLDWQTHLSLSHDGGNSLAFVIIETIGKE